jgi:hypothetical protein
VQIFAHCEPGAGAPTKQVLEAHASRHVSLGRRFGPFLLPWTAFRRFLDSFQSAGWSDPSLDDSAAGEAP